MKQYDLMHSINSRGTYLCTKYCLPHLKKVRSWLFSFFLTLQAANPQILTLSPPITLQNRWCVPCCVL